VSAAKNTYLSAIKTKTEVADINSAYKTYKTKLRFYLKELESRVNAYKEENDLNE
jgi:hypothetical protein